MTELYVFRGTTGHAEMVTDDKNGKKLPSHPFGEWVFSRTINVVTGTRLTGGVDCRQVLANVSKDGYHHWPELESTPIERETLIELLYHRQASAPTMSTFGPRSTAGLRSARSPKRASAASVASTDVV